MDGAAAINRDPVYQQIVDLLRKEMAEGKHAPGDRFPSERSLAERFGISRTTANKVLSMLVADGTLQHRKGLGAFVSGPTLEHDMDVLSSFTERARLQGEVPRTAVLAFESVRHPSLGASLHLVRLRFVGEVPVIYEQRWLRGDLCRDLTRSMAEGSLYAALQGDLGLRLGRAEQRARAVVPGKEERRLLRLRAGAACLRVDGKGFLADGTLLWLEDTLFSGDRFEITGTLGLKDEAEI